MDKIPAWLRSLLMQQAEGWARHALTLAAGYLVAKGLANHDQANELIGALVTAGAVIWSMRQKVTAGRTTRIQTQAFTDGVTQALAQLSQQFGAPTADTTVAAPPAALTTHPGAAPLSPVRPVYVDPNNDLEPIP